MSTYLRTILFICFSIVYTGTVNSQGRDNIVRDIELSDTLRVYLLDHLDLHTFDSAGNAVPLDSAFLQEQYGQTCITSFNLKTDSIVMDKKMIGVYAFRFADISSRPHLYLQYPNRILFVDLDGEFDLNQLLKKIMSFLDEISDQFTLQEKVKTIEGVMEIVYLNKFADYSW